MNDLIDADNYNGDKFNFTSTTFGNELFIRHAHWPKYQMLLKRIFIYLYKHYKETQMYTAMRTLAHRFAKEYVRIDSDVNQTVKFSDFIEAFSVPGCPFKVITVNATGFRSVILKDIDQINYLVNGHMNKDTGETVNIDFDTLYNCTGRGIPINKEKAVRRIEDAYNRFFNPDKAQT